MVDRLAKRVQQSWETLDAITDYCHSRFVLRAPRTRVIAFATVPANAPLTPGRAWCTLRAERDRAALEDMYGRQLEQLGSKFREKMGTMDDKLGSASNPTHAAMGPGSHCSCNVCAVAGGGGLRGRFAVFRTLPPVILRLVTEATQMGTMRCQLKTQIDVEVVGALKEVVDEDRAPAKQIRGLSSVTAACLVRCTSYTVHVNGQCRRSG